MSTEPAVFLHPQADLSRIERVAVLPFTSETGEPAAAAKVQDLFQIELLALDTFEVVEPGAVLRAFLDTGVDSNQPLGPKELDRLGKTLRVQAFFLGSVSEYRERMVGSMTSPSVAISLRLVEVESGEVLWSAAAGRSGLSWVTRLFGVGETSLQDRTLDVVRDGLWTLLS